MSEEKLYFITYLDKLIEDCYQDAKLSFKLEPFN